jgi:hypothetical protein
MARATPGQTRERGVLCNKQRSLWSERRINRWRNGVGRFSTWVKESGFGGCRKEGEVR